MTQSEDGDLVVCVISREGTPVMNRMISQTLAGLRGRGHRITGVHLEGTDAALSREFREFCDHAIIHPSPRGFNPLANARRLSALLFGGLRELVARACREGARAIVYLEGDKFTFVPEVAVLAAPILEGRADFSLAVRSPEGYAKFPWIQRLVETNVNRYMGRLTGLRTDYLYGPRAFSPEVAALFDEYRDDDWGAMMYPVTAAIVRGYRFEAVTVPGDPQPGYIEKYDAIMRSPPAHFVWRSIQCLGIMKATRAAARR